MEKVTEKELKSLVLVARRVLVPALVEEALANVAFWEEDLSDFPGFAQAVGDQLNSIMRNGMRAALKNIYSEKNLADTL